MPRVPSISPATGEPTSSCYVHTLNSSFVDNFGRTLLLRGVNLSGSSKAPAGHPSYLKDELWEAGESGKMSFVNRPLNLDDGTADQHLARLRGWGFNVLRFPITWEALEHEGPGIYDLDFMDYVVRILRRCKRYGFKVFIDPHQDTWSRYSGGSGAPYWTLLASGMDPHEFTATQAAILHSEYPNAQLPNPSSLPAMIWSTNYGRLVSLTLYTLFFAGRDFAPKCIIDGENIQDYLQNRFINAFGTLADHIRDAGDLFEECVIGWDSLNEPAEGFCGWEDLNVIPDAQGSTLRLGSRPTPAESLRLGMGQSQTVEHWAFGSFGPRRDGMVTVDPKGHKIWLSPEAEPGGRNTRWGWKRDPRWVLGTCIWALHGVWDVNTGEILIPDYFRAPPFDDERPVVFEMDFWRPHFRKYARRIRESHPEAILFVQPPVFAQPPQMEPDDLRGRGCYSAHYYDGLTLVSRHWNWFNADALGMLRGKYTSMWQAVRIGEKAIRKSLQEQLGILKDDADIIGPYPTLLGEIGTPFDMDGKRSYGWTEGGKYAGDYSSQQKALDASLNAADGPNALNYTIWTYCPDNTHEWGDGWNMEDLSLWSSDDMKQQSEYDSPQVSSAMLLKRKGSAVLSEVKPSAASSTLSLSTLAESGVPTLDLIRPDEELHMRGNPYSFLSNGARAVKAFARPYPVAVVGVPSDISFDIPKAEFKLTVTVKAEDGPVTSLSSTSAMFLPSSPVNEEDSGSPILKGDRMLLSELPTEIFIPLIHYARKDLVDPTLSSDYDLPRTTKPKPRWGPANGILPKTSASSSTTTLTPAPPGLSSLVHIKVQISAGRWEVEGQTLRWWYPVPPVGSLNTELTHTISVTRAEGPIKVQAQDRPADSLWGFCGEVCQSDSCTVM